MYKDDNSEEGEEGAKGCKENEDHGGWVVICQEWSWNGDAACPIIITSDDIDQFSLVYLINTSANTWWVLLARGGYH